jgi:hypothetical protein
MIEITMEETRESSKQTIVKSVLYFQFSIVEHSYLCI